MSFNISGQIIQIDDPVKAHSKCIVKDLYSSVMILIPYELLKDIHLNDEVEIWGHLKGYNYNGKIYNNLFAKSLIKYDQLYTYLKMEHIDDQENPQFKILKYAQTPFLTEDFNNLFREEFKEEALNSGKEKIGVSFNIETKRKGFIL